MTVNVYEQYFKADHMFNGVKRRAALVALVSDSCDGMIKYSVTITFFPHKNKEDFAVSYDDYHEKVIFSSKGRRSKKREANLLEGFEGYIEELIKDLSAKVYWDRPITQARRG